ncbi:hypothetical protein [Ruania zhangjianzhongii]|uniref:hypothetical protein n=1 Tax=Ruania zhangjianzhongii TaxID=2603206 RepID=UPI0011CA57F3|nr:hypothetical protein [Ruania zhangjianzhongii]
MSSDNDPVLQLGRDLADALDRSDVVGRWMSHHLADLISQCEADPNDAELATTTRNVVLMLWERKRGAVFDSEPYAYLRPILRAIARLDPDPEPWAFYRAFTDDSPPTEALTTYPLLRAMSDIDREVGQLIRFGVAVAAREASAREDAWVISALATAQTEEDRAVQALQRLERRLRLQAEPVPRTNLAISHLDGVEEPEESSSSGPPHPAASEPSADGANDLADADAFASSDVLLLELQAAVNRCRRVFDLVADLVGEAPGAVMEESTGQTAE